MGVEEALRNVAFPLVRFGSFVANALLFGILVVILRVVRPAFSSLGGDEWSAARRRLARRLEGMVQAALTGAIAVTLIGLLLQVVLAAELRGGDLSAQALGETLATRFGRWYAVRIPLLIALAFLLGGRVRTRALMGAGDSAEGPSKAWWALWGAASVLLLVTVSASGHAAVARPVVVAIANDVVHLAAGGAWFSGIIVLGVVLPDAWRRRSEPDALRVLTPAVEGFSRVAVVSIVLVGITGSVNALFHVGKLAHLTSTGYGRAVLAKIVLFLGVLALGGVNHFFVRRRLRKALEEGEVRPSARSVFRRTIAGELVIALLLMGVTGILVGLSRTRQGPVSPAADAPATVSATPGSYVAPNHP